MKSGTMSEVQLTHAIRSEQDPIQLADMLVEVGRQGFAALVPLVESHATHKDEGVRGAVLRSLLGFMSSKEHIELGIKMLHEDAAPAVQYDAAASLASFAKQNPSSLDRVCEELAVEVKTSANSRVSQRCLNELGDLYGAKNTRLPDGQKWKDAKWEIVEALYTAARARTHSV